MKDFQFVIQNFLKNHEKHKKYIALLLVLSIVVSFAVPFSLIMPAVSMTGELICGMEEHIHSDECYELSCGLEESDEHLHNADCYTLVCDIPEHIHSQECYSDYEEENYEEDLSQFDPDNNYLINLVNATSISSISGSNTTDDVTLLAGSTGTLREGCNTVQDVINKANRLYAIGIASQFSVFLQGDFNVKNADSEGRTAVGGNLISSKSYEIGNGDYVTKISLDSLINNTGFAHAIVNGATVQNLAPTSWNKCKFIDEGGNIIQEDYISKRYWISDNTTTIIGPHNDYIAYCPATWSNNYEDYFYRDTNVFNVAEQFDELKNRSEKISKITATGTTTISEDGKVVTFDGSKAGADAQTIYFTMNEWNDNIREVRFAHVPENANLIVNCDGNANIGVDGQKDIFSTYINDTCISRQDSDGQNANENNNKKSEQILYNFYNATNVFIDANFNGTILAPDADVTSGDDCNGHLSGALIAKSFTGGLEFGYRPYQGTIDILGSSMGYTIPVDKVVTGATNQWLAGAKFEIIDSENNVVNSFTSGEGTNFVDIPSKVDFTGGTNYTGVESLTGTYTIKEVSAPEGYIADTENTCTVTITEEIQSDGLIETGSGTIPTHIKATVTFENGQSFEIDLKDTYSFDGSSSKQIRRELTINGEIFYLEINNGKVSEVSKNDGNSTDTGTIVITDDKQHTTDVLTSEISSYVVTTQENGEDVPVTVTSMIDVFNNEAEGLNAYKINKIYLENANVSGGYTLTFYYNDKTSVVYEGNSINNGDLDLGNLSKENVIGISIKFNQNVSSSNFWIQENDGTNFPTIFGTNYNQSKTFEAGKTYVFPESAIKQESTTVTSTETTVVSSYVTSYYTTTVTAQYDKYATIIADPSTAQIYPTTTVDSKYYYNPDDIMMMPMPSANLTFENRCGLLFKKVDSNGNPLSGATIKLQQKNGDNYADVADTVWNWTGSSFTIDPVNLDSTEVYRFHEESAPTGYETAPDIYFKKTDTNKILWGYAENNLENNLDLTYDNNRTITMTDTKITGAKVKLKKTKDDGTTLLDGAKFRLYSADGENGTLVYPTSGEGFIVTNGEIDLYETFKNGSSNANADYIQNGYLKEGLYYLYEVSAPTGYQAGQKFYFTINKNNGVYDVETGLPQYIVAYQGALQKDSSVNQYNDSNTYTNVTAIEVLFTFTGDDINKAINDSDINIQGNKNWINGIGEWSSLFKNSSLGSYTLNNSGNEYVIKYTFNSPVTMDGSKDIQYQSNKSTVTIKEVRVYGDSSSGGSSSGGSSTTDFGEGITVSNKEITLNSTGLSRAVTDDMITNDSVVVTLTFNTPSGEFGWGNGIYKAKINNEDKSNTNGFKFNQEKTTRSLKVSDICNLFGIATSDFKNISEFKIECWNTTTISDVSFTNITASTDPDTPTGGESENTSNNTEDGAIDKDTTVTDVGYVGLIAKNSPMGDKTSITVKKNWVDDTGYETLRPDKITVQLYRSTSQNLKPNELTDEMKSGDSVTIQDANGKWEYTWTNLDTKDSNNQNYYYYVKEEVTALNDYTVSYENNGITSGDVKIKNTLKTVDISVKKDWSVPDGVTGVTNPASVTVKLQTSSDGTSWTDVSGKTLTLNESNSWTGKFEKLPEGKYYRVVETNIPNGWTASYSTDGKKFDNSGNITVTNTLSLESLNIKKNWEDNVGDVRPDKINIKLYRSTTPPAGSATSNSVQPISLQKPTNNYEDYSRLLQYSLYFYDANMCGDDVANSSDLTWRNNCHTDDAVLGGYHDAGDHVMFGLPQGYTASTLGWSYYENKDIYDGLGQTEHYQKIMKRFCDFFVASTTLDSNNNVTKFFYQKGNGGTDHNYWVSPENQTQEQRGGLLYTTNSASDIAAEYAAALAQYAINFPNDSDKAKYLNCAKALYAFSTKYNSRTKNGVEGFYWTPEDSGGRCTDEQAWAAAWLYLATNDDTYKNECQSKLSGIDSVPIRGYFWDDVALGAMIVYKKFIDNSYDWSVVTNYLSSKCDPNSSFVILDEWGSARHNTALQMIALSASKFSDSDDIDYTDWCKKQMNYILGNNSISSNENSSTCFVVGFADNSAKYPHHRGASCVSGWDSYNASGGIYPNGHELIGALVAGPKADGSYKDHFTDTVGNEVALDYNATLVGAAAALFDVYHTGTLKIVASDIGADVEKVYLKPNPVLTVYGKSTMYKGKNQTLTAENATGTVTWSSSDSGILTVDENGLVTAVSNGEATITATDNSGNSASFDITVTSSAITPDIPEGAELVDTITLSSSKSWQETPSNLPITDGQGNTYYYYIAEVDDRGEIISNKVSGYIPVEYDNGKSLSETGNTELLSVTNKKSDVDEGSMPSTGGTGTQPYKVIGMVMAGGALIMLGIRRRKKHC